MVEHIEMEQPVSENRNYGSNTTTTFTTRWCWMLQVFLAVVAWLDLAELNTSPSCTNQALYFEYNNTKINKN